MRMRILSLAVLASMPLAVSYAQTSQSHPDPVTAALEMARSILDAERQVVIAQALPLTREEGEQFWPVYREYHQGADELMGRRLELVRRFADNYDRMTDEMAEELITDVLENDEADTKLKRKYLRRFQDALPTDKLLTYYQLENKIDTYIRARLVSQIPLLPDIAPRTVE